MGLFGSFIKPAKFNPVQMKDPVDLVALARRAVAAQQTESTALITHQAFLAGALAHAEEMWSTGVCSEKNTILPSKKLNPFYIKE
jgi:hypothetical protein